MIWLRASSVLIHAFCLLLSACQLPGGNEITPTEENPAVTDDVETTGLDVVSVATLPLPESMRAGATVLGYSEVGDVVSLRDGSNGIICLGDKPGDDRIEAVCYHASLGPFMARGRELSAEGVGGVDRYRIRHEEMDAGTLAAPDPGATLYNLTVPVSDFDPATAKPGVYSIYIPGATTASTGLPDKPAHSGAPWIMRGGTPSAHIMVISSD